jgi:HPt (histidine-containing phosphotransfer) domain-containing protein
MKGDRERCLEAGMDAYVSKPVEAEELARVIGEVVADSAKSASLPDGANSAIDMPALMARLRGDTALLKELAELFLAEQVKIQASIDDAVARRDAAALQYAAHALKGAVGNFMAKDAFQAAQQLEELGRDGDLSDVDQVRARVAEAVEQLKSALAAALIKVKTQTVQ